ncbi:MAG: DUF2330 domain-containing protein [Myxococcota bacterium]
MWWSAIPALACGGFFCDNVEPVVQRAERLLFRDDGEEWTTFVEVQFEGPPSSFGWVVPIPRPLDPDSDIELAPPGLFDALERVTAPRFVGPDGAPEAADLAYSAGCGCEGFGASVGGVGFDLSTVEVVGEAVVGPYELQVLTAAEGADLTAWLQQAGYQIPFSAFPIVDGYLEQGWSFLGIKLRAEVGEGPIDTLVLRCGSDEPQIPLRLTAIASVPSLEIVAYVLGGERYAPSGDWSEVPFAPELPGGGDPLPLYLGLLREAIGSGRAFRTEFAAPAEAVVPALPPELAAALGSGAYLTRMRSFVSPAAMTSDPVFAPSAGPDVSNQVVLVPLAEVAWLGLGAGLAWVLVGGAVRRR